MKKNLRSIEKLSTGSYEYLRVEAEEAEKLVDAKSHIYISKEEYKRQSKFYHFEPCRGTVRNVVNAEGTKSQETLHNINWFKASNYNTVNSTKIAKCSSQSREVKRKNKYAIKLKTVAKKQRAEARLGKVTPEL